MGAESLAAEDSDLRAPRADDGRDNGSPLLPVSGSGRGAKADSHASLINGDRRGPATTRRRRHAMKRFEAAQRRLSGGQPTAAHRAGPRLRLPASTADDSSKRATRRPCHHLGHGRLVEISHPQVLTVAHIYIRAWIVALSRCWSRFRVNFPPIPDGRHDLNGQAQTEENQAGVVHTDLGLALEPDDAYIRVCD
jgi:hypothetical protein